MKQISEQEISILLNENFPNSKIKVTDQMGDGYSFAINVTSDKFKNLNRVKQHQLVMKCLKELLKERLHAVTLKTEAI